MNTIQKPGLEASVQASLDLADTALQTNAVTSVDGQTGAVDLSAVYATAAQGTLADTALQSDDVINDLSQAYEFPTVAAFKASLIEFPDGKTIRLLDRGADFTKSSGQSGSGSGTIPSTNVSQSISIILGDSVKLSSFGVTGSGDETVGYQEALATGLDIDINVDFSVSITTSSPSISHTNTTYFPWQNTNYCAVEITTPNQRIFGTGKISVLSIGAGVVSGYNAIHLVREVAGVEFSGFKINTNSSVTVINTTGFLIVGDTDYTANTLLDGSRITNVEFDGDGIAGANSSAFIIVLSMKNVYIKNNNIINAGAGCSAHFCQQIHVDGNIAQDILELVDFDKAIKHFTVNDNIVNTTKGGGDALIELNGSQFGTVTNNTLFRNASYNGRGITLAGKVNFGNQVMPVDDQGIFSVVTNGNTISGCEDGIFIPASETTALKLDISHNIITDIRGANGIAIQLQGTSISCNHNVIDDCKLGIIKEPNSVLQNFSISSNKLNNVDANSIQLQGDDSPTGKELRIGTISLNIIESSATGAANEDQPIWLFEPDRLSITGNVIQTATEHGIRTSSTSGGTLFNTLSGNIVTGAVGIEYRVPGTIAANLQSAANVGTIA